MTEQSVKELTRLRNRLVDVLSKIDGILGREEAEYTKGDFYSLSKEYRIEYIVSRAAAFWGVQAGYFKGAGRGRQRPLRRKMLCKLLWEYARLSHWDIAAELEYKVNSTVSYAINRLDEMLAPAIYGDVAIQQEWKDLIKFMDFDGTGS